MKRMRTLVLFLAFIASAWATNPTCNAGVSQTSTVGGSITLDGSGSVSNNGNPTLTYAWSVIAGSATLSSTTTVNPTASAIAGTGTNSFGSVNFQLVVTDTSSQSSTCTVHDGAVIAASNGVINLTAEGLDATSQRILGPLIAYSRNTWPWADTAAKSTLDNQWVNQQTNFTTYWTTSLGTASFNNGSAVWHRTSGALLNAPCGGGTTPLYQAVLIPSFTGTDGLTHRTYYSVVSCAADGSSITVSNPYPATPNTPWPVTCSPCTGGWSWGYYEGGYPAAHPPYDQFGYWANGGAPNNYYDNVKAYYAMYWRSGIDTYLTEANTLADEWWQSPFLDYGYACYSGDSTTYAINNQTCPAPGYWKNLSATGLVLRALSSGAAAQMRTGLKVVWDLVEYLYEVYYPASAPYGIDQREFGYSTGVLAYCAMLDPTWTGGNSGKTCQQDLDANISTIWAPTCRNDVGTGVWGNFLIQNSGNGGGSVSSISRYGGTGVSACATNGSAAVTGTNTSWSSAAPSNIWFFTPQAGHTSGDFPLNNGTNANTIGDSQFYNIATINSDTSITLYTTYQGTTGCGKGFVIGYPEGYTNVGQTTYSGFIGWGWQPYAQGHLAQAFFLAADAMTGYSDDPTAKATYQGYGDSTVQALLTYGLQPYSPAGPTVPGGLYNGAWFVGCNSFPIPQSNVPCFPYQSDPGHDPAGDRIIATELMRAFAEDYLVFGSGTVKTATDGLMSRLFSKPGTGGPNPDGYYLDQFEPGTLIYNCTPGVTPSCNPPGYFPWPKWTGQLAGYTEAVDMWPAARMQVAPSFYTTLHGRFHGSLK